MINARDQQSNVRDDTLRQRWGVSMEVAGTTRKMTAQRGVRTLTEDIGQRFRTRQHQLSSPLLMTKLYSDTMFSEKTSAIGNICAQLHMTVEGYASGEPMKSKADTHISLGGSVEKTGYPTS